MIFDYPELLGIKQVGQKQMHMFVLSDAGKSEVAQLKILKKNLWLQFALFVVVDYCLVSWCSLKELINTTLKYRAVKQQEANGYLLHICSLAVSLGTAFQLVNNKNI